jgi:hypothetical protein
LTERSTPGGTLEESPSARIPAQQPDRQTRIEALRAAKRKSDRRRSLAALCVCLLGAGAVFGKSGYNWVEHQLDNPLKRSIAAFGVPLAAAGCGSITADRAAPAGQHVDEGTRVSYTTVPPTSGRHYDRQVSFDAEPFFTTKDNPPVENLVQNLEHGYTVLWYDSNLPRNSQDQIQGLARKLRDDAIYQLFIATPWDPAYGNLPAGKPIALSHWSGPTGANGPAYGHRLFCGQLSGQAVREFMDKFPATDAPERNIR